MALPLVKRAPVGSSAAFVIWSATGQIFNGAAFENFTPANIATYAIAGADPNATGRFTASWPAAITAGGDYMVEAGTVAGASLTATDLALFDPIGIVSYDGTQDVLPRALGANVAAVAAKTVLIATNGGDSPNAVTAQAYLTSLRSWWLALFNGISTSLLKTLRLLSLSSVPDASALADLNAGGGAFDPTQASLQAIRARGDSGAWTGQLTGPSGVTLTWVDSGGNPVPSVAFTVAGQGAERAGTNGVKSFGLLDGTYTVISAPTAGVVFANFTLTVAGVTAATITGTASAITLPAPVGQTTAWVTTYNGMGGLKPGAGVTFRLVEPGLPGVWDRTNFTVYSAQGTALLQVALLANARYEAKTEKGDWVAFTTSGGATFALPEILSCHGS